MENSEAKEHLQRAKKLYEEKKYAEVAPIYEKYIDLCGISELYSLGYIYSRKSEGIEPDQVKAHQYYLAAAEKGGVRSKIEAGKNFINGKGTPQDIPQGLQMLTEAAVKHNSSVAQNALGLVYYDGEGGVPIDYSQALQWFEKAVQQNEGSAFYNMGLLYEQGKGVEKDLHKAYDYYLKALRYGSGLAKSKLPNIEKKLGPEFTFELVNCNKDLQRLTEKIVSGRTLKISMLLSGPRGSGKKAYVQYLAGKLGLQASVKSLLDFESKQNIVDKIKEFFNEAIEKGQMLVFEKIDLHMANQSVIATILRQLKVFPFPFIYLVGDETKIGADIRDEFMFNVQFAYLGRTQSQQAFRMMFNRDVPDELSSIGALTPQDYKQVKQRLFVLGEESNDAEILSSLQEISQKKTSSIIQNAGVENFNAELINADTDVIELCEKLKNQGTLAFSLLLYGPPGTGKSEYLRYIAEQLGIEIIFKRASDILSKWTGEAEKAIAHAFQEAAMRKAFLVFDEADSLLAKRDGESKPWQIQQVNEMLTWMESHKYPFACTTNLMGNIDPAALRRFVFKIKFDYMKKEQVKKAFTVFFHMDAPSRELDGLANLTPGDFAVVKKSAEIFGELADAGRLAKLLKEESQKKSASITGYFKKAFSGSLKTIPGAVIAALIYGIFYTLRAWLIKQ